uniref:Transcriptional regulator, TetR family n=1 Tax=Caulobacter sp. (strain K31) TaxID=366602 RepID=B0T6F9_CAUSK
MPRNLTPAEVEDFRARLCDAAETLFARHGLDGVSLRQIAGEMGVSAMTPYRYFKDKDEVLAAVRTRAFDRFAAALEAASALGGQGSAGAYVDFALRHPDAYRLMFDVTQPNTDDYPQLRAAIERARRTMRPNGAEARAGGEAAGSDELIGHVFWAALHGVIMLELAHKISSRIDPTTLRKTLLEALGRGLGLETAAPAA